jgi:putative transcriptional regulator
MRARSILGAFMAIAGATAVTAAVPPWPPAPIRELSQGKFLIARPHSGGPVFGESVLLLLDHGFGGALGLIINQPTGIELARLLPDVEALRGRSDRAFFGGPVEGHRMMLLFRSDDPPAESRRITRDIYSTGNFEALRAVVGSADRESRFRVYIGYAGWAPGQLEAEVARGDWLIAPSDARAIFDMDPEKVWREFIDRGSGLQAERLRPRLRAAHRSNSSHGALGRQAPAFGPISALRNLAVGGKRSFRVTTAMDPAGPSPDLPRRRPRATGR